MGYLQLSGDVEDASGLEGTIAAARADFLAKLPQQATYSAGQLKAVHNAVVKIYGAASNLLARVQYFSGEGYVPSVLTSTMKSAMLPWVKSQAQGIVTNYETWWRNNMARYSRVVATIPVGAEYAIMPDAGYKTAVAGFFDQTTQVVTFAKQLAQLEYAQFHDPLVQFFVGLRAGFQALYDGVRWVAGAVWGLPGTIDTLVTYAVWGGAALLAYKIWKDRA